MMYDFPKFTMKRLDDLLNEFASGAIKYYDVDGCPAKIFVPVKVVVEEKVLGGQDCECVLNIKDKELFLEKVQAFLDVAREFYARYMDFYVDEEGAYDRVMLSFLFYCATNADLDNVNSFIDHRIAILKDKTIEEGHEVIGKFEDAEVRVKFGKSGPGMEGPWGARFFFDNTENPNPDWRSYDGFMYGSDEQKVATTNCIFFGIDGDTVKIFSIQNPGKRPNEANKKFDRYVRKLGKGVEPDSQISQVSPMALATLTLFVSYMQKRGFKKFEAPDFMPIRYFAHIQTDKINHKNTPFEEIEAENDRIQFNITNRFLTTFLRYCHHFDNAKMFYDNSGITHILIDGEPTKKDDNIIYKLDGAVEIQENHAQKE